MLLSPFILGSALSHLECARCGRREEPDRLQTVCSACGGPLLARYDLAREDLPGMVWDLLTRPCDLWRFSELLPVRAARYRIGLGEGMTPILSVPRLARELGMADLWVKDEGVNPTASFKARGMAVAVARAAELGASAVYAPSAGNAGVALAAYAARHGLRALVAFPSETPPAFVRQARAQGAEVIVEGSTIREAAAALHAQIEKGNTWSEAFDLSTLKEPYRVEGKKTMGYEIGLALPEMPDVIVYPTGGGTGLIGIWKAFEEMRALGWIGGKRPRMVAVQVEGCRPIVDAFRAVAQRAIPATDARTRCWGLRVPAPFADVEILRVLYDSRGWAIDVPEETILPAMRLAARTEGLDLAPEGAAAVTAIRRLLIEERIKPEERVLVLNTAASWMYQ
ncbi:MAG: threonine synthase [Candidatus Eisenbacteria bacterium]|nr:threonine synthase [Candidatus Eisenbacteria bacterium]